MQAPRRNSEASASGATYIQQTVPHSLPHFTLLVAGAPAGKTSFLRLLLETCDLAPDTPKSQLSSIIQFIEGCAEPTSSIRHVSLDLLGDLDGSDRLQHFQLTLIDTPSFLFTDEAATDRLMADLLNLIDGRLAEALDESRASHAAERFITLCIYFLDPEKLVTLSKSSQGRSNVASLDQPSLFLDKHNVHIIRQLAERVNVLPVIAKADILMNEQLAAVKVAIRRDLAEAGIGFGIFDRYRPSQPSAGRDEPSRSAQGPLSKVSPSSPSSAPSISGMPYTLISPDAFAHSDGVSRLPPSKTDLMQRYAPSSQPRQLQPADTFVRTYRWGVIDVLDPAHCDFVLLKYAVFKHLQTLHDYTKSYLYDKFRSTYLRQSPSGRSRPSGPQVDSVSRPVLAINTSTPAHPPPSSRSLQMPSGRVSGHGAPVQSHTRDPVISNGSSVTPTHSVHGPRPGRHHHPRKITVACQFCRSRKLKCDGARPACSQCSKRSHPCDYLHTRKNARRRDEEESESDSGNAKSEENDELMYSPTISRPPSQQARPVLPPFSQSHDIHIHSLPPLRPPERYEEPPPSSSHSKASAGSTRQQDTELPHIATLSLPEISPTTPGPMSAASLPPLRPPLERPPSPIRKRSATVPGKSDSGRLPGATGPKIIACNFCRARKTKCDGSQPCQQCAKRSLPCNYVTDGGKRGQRRTSAATKPSVGSPQSPPSSRMVTTPASAMDHSLDARIRTDDNEGGSLEDLPSRPSKRIRMSSPPPSMTIPP